MNLVTLITGIVIAMAILELLLQGMPDMKRDLFYLAMLVAWVGFTSKYYYGPDIATYVPLYGRTGTVLDFLQGNHPGGYEPGYMFFCSLCKTFGLSFWWMTAVISTLFFYAVFAVLRKLKDKRVLALVLVLVVMKDLIYAQLRQCLAVSFFVFAILKAEDWKDKGFGNSKDALSAVVLGLIAVTMHKSGIYLIGLTAAYYLMQRYSMSKNTWNVLLLVLLLMMIVPTWNLIQAITDLLHLGKVTMDSIRLHLSYMRLVQTNLLVYGMVLLVLSMYAREQSGRRAMIASAAVGMIVIVVMYQYYYMVNRLRSYFVLPVIYYAFSTMREASERKLPYVTLTRQLCEIVLLLFFVGKTYSFDKNMRMENGGLLDSCTVFDLMHGDAEIIQERQLGKAQRFWDSKQRSDSKFKIPDDN